VQHLWTFLVLVAAAINLAPVVGAVSAERMAVFYGVGLADPNLQILMRHRAVLFGLVGGVLLVAAFHPPLRTLGYVLGFSSMLSFLLIAWGVGGYGAEIRRVIVVDVVGIAALAAAGLVHALWLRTSSA
jgi:hypothetical protein